MLPCKLVVSPFSVMTQQQLYEWITHPELLNRDTLYELRTLLARYPYFQTVRLLYLKNLFLLHDITFGEELRKAALYVADRKVLFLSDRRGAVLSFLLLTSKRSLRRKADWTVLFH